MQAEVYFSNIKDEIIKNLKNVNKEIKVAVAWLTDEDIIRALTQQKELGIDVQIVISDSSPRSVPSQTFRKAVATGFFLPVRAPAEVKCLQRKIHNFII